MSLDTDHRNKKTMQTSDLIFPTASTVSVHKQLTSIKKASLSITNRLRSIERDADFVRWVAAHYARTSTAPSHYGGYDGIFEDGAATTGALHDAAQGGSSTRTLHLLPVIANERCGSWYVPPHEKTGGSSYWKSTDGHWGVWAFSLRRLNVGVLNVLASARGGGAVVVDSTRQGKQLPDAFSKTVPIWCAVLNRLLFPEQPWSAYHGFERCKAVVSESEAEQIEAKLPMLVETVKELHLDVASLKEKLRKPVKCFWIARGLGPLPPTPLELLGQLDASDAGLQAGLDFHPLYLCMASEYQESATEASYSGYVQGAGDDAEAWAHGLTPELFWRYRQRLLDDDVTEEDVPALIDSLLAQDKAGRDTASSFNALCILANERLILGQLSDKTLEIPGLSPRDIIIVCSSQPNIKLAGCPEKRLLQLRCGQGKLGSRNLRGELDKISPFFRASEDIRKVYVCCETGKDLSVGVALVLMCLYLGDDGEVVMPDAEKERLVDKASVKRKLGIIMSTWPSANPSRATLNSINAFLMKP